MKKIILALLLIPFFGTLQAQEKIAFTFNRLALSVKKLEESATFYAAVLQLQVMVRETRTKVKIGIIGFKDWINNKSFGYNVVTKTVVAY